MDASAYDLVRGHYDLSKPLEAARFQRTAMDFLAGVRANAFHGPEGSRLMDEFCAFVSSRDVWRLAQNVVPEFRSAPAPSAKEDAPESCLGYILRQCKLPLLPAPRNDDNVLTSEQKMLRHRHRRYVEYLVTGGTGKDGASPSDHAEIEGLCQAIYNARSVVVQDGDVDLAPGVKDGITPTAEDTDKGKREEKAKEGGDKPLRQ